ncbi:hypothetical protein BJP25_07260 [Actinokineospora bangkokensis]|uniref:Uncharacterized protein n=1 Tax=Actinokineospora bangkokensis TaxID=1193682 RepID=A0A1Q9LTD7_9PSEU|nr:hypothetical protein BJP25_07260 [Actinokineospora bangkokensis]
MLALQPDFNPAQTPEMLNRGRLIHDDLGAWLASQLPDLTSPTLPDLAVNTSDGVGLRTEIPWARVHSEARSPRATDGWYVVYLFDAPGTAVYLTLMQGTTEWSNNTARTRPLTELAASSARARTALASSFESRPDLLMTIDLRGKASKRAKGYQAGTVAAFRYPREAIPAEDVLVADLRYLVRVLDRLHTLFDTPPEVVEALEVADRTAGRRARGQGTGLTTAEKLAVERRAVNEATAYLEGEGYTVVDVGATQSYDLDARRGDEHLFVEVKGTTSAGEEVILTRAEVELNAREHPNTMLVVVSEIALDRSGPTATGGHLRVHHPWLVDPSALTPISYRYRTP